MRSTRHLNQEPSLGPEAPAFTLRRQAWAWFLRNVVLPAGDLALGHPMMRRLKMLEQAQWMDWERLQRERDRLVADTVMAAYAEVPFYRDHLDKARIRPTSIRSADDLRRIPMVTKDMLRAGYPDRVTRRTGFRVTEKKTSGSTGQNFIALEDTFTSGWYRASFMLALRWAGWQYGMPHLQTGVVPDRKLIKSLKDKLLGCYYVPVTDLSDATLDRHLAEIENASIEHIWGYPGSLYHLARRAQYQGWNTPMASLVTWGDNLYPWYRTTIEEVFKRKVHDTYGCGEGMHIAAQCGHGHNYHIHTLDVVVHYEDEKGEPVAQGEPGRLVVTRLLAGAMPFIRYQIGDVGVAGPQEPCPCGRGFERMESIQGRETDIVITPEGNRLVVHLFNMVLEHIPEVGEFQVIQEEPDTIRLVIVPALPIGSNVRTRIISELHANGARGLRIEIELVDRIPLTAGGKRRYVVSTLDQHRETVP